MEIGLIRKVDIDNEMQQSYLNYAMSVIVARALPDARDGLKPVQRRILYAMYDMGLRPGTAYKKSARIVGEVLGKYHPHGDMAVYDAMARLAQGFSVRYPLVDGQGNFGSVDGDPPAAMRYTEARLRKFAMELMTQIDCDTVDFNNNFDDTLSEPEVVPAAVPNLLVNGASGIAVGMATNIPPHNLDEVVDALVFMLRKWEKIDDIAISDLVNFVQGPDFPTGGIIIQEGDKNDLMSAYGTGRGKISVRGRVHVEEMGRGRNRIIITELPYLTNKTNLIERIAYLVREGIVEGITDLRDESDRQGMRIVIEVSKSADTDDVLRDLYRRTPLQNTIGISLLALVNGGPRLLTLKQLLKVYLEHRLNVIQRRSKFDLERARQRVHVLEGLRIAIGNLNAVVELIRDSSDAEKACRKLMRQFKLTKIQADAILDMPLRRLAALERKRIEQEYKSLLKKIKGLETLLRSPQKMRLVIKKELLEIKQKYGDRRRTQIVSLQEGESGRVLLTSTELTPAKVVWVGVTSDGHISRTLTDKLPRISGRQAPTWLLKTNTHHTLYLVSRKGQAVSASVEALPETEKFSDGALLSKVLPFERGESLAAIVSVPPRDEIEGDYFMLTCTRFGMVKKSSLFELPGPSAHQFTLVKVNSEDAIIWMTLTDGESDIYLISNGGMVIRFSEQDVRQMGLVAAGVNGIKLKSGDSLIGAERHLKGGGLFVLASNGQAWRFPTDEFSIQGRYGQGVRACRLSEDVRLVGTIFGKSSRIGLAHYKRAASRLIRLGKTQLGKRLRVGKVALPVKNSDVIIGVTPVLDGLAFWKRSRKQVVRKQHTAKK